MFMRVWSDMASRRFWLAVLKIIWINILLSGDNAVVIAMACRGLPPRQRLWGMIFGAGVAVVLRIIFTVVSRSSCCCRISSWSEGSRCSTSPRSSWSLKTRTKAASRRSNICGARCALSRSPIIVMSLDNVIAIAAAAQNNFALILIGLGISVPLIVVGAALIMALLERFPILVWAGAALLGWIVGEVYPTDPAVLPHLVAKFGEDGAYKIEIASAVIGAILVVVVGGLWRRSKLQARADKVSAAE